MANLELTIESAVLARAQQRALEQGTSLDVVVRDYLTDYVEWRDQVDAMREFVEQAAASGGRSKGPWTREELYERKARDEPGA